MTMPLDHLRGQIVRCSTVGHPISVLFVGPPEIRHFDDVSFTQEKVLRLDIPMDDFWVQGVEIGYRFGDMVDILRY